MAVLTETLLTAIHTNYLAILLLVMYGPILIVNIFHVNCNDSVRGFFFFSSLGISKCNCCSMSDIDYRILNPFNISENSRNMQRIRRKICQILFTVIL